MTYPSRIILTDADGVLLAWEDAFHDWMASCGHEIKTDEEARQSYYLYQHYTNISKNEMSALIKQFNEGPNIRWLHSMRDSAEYVRRLHEEHGYQFQVITSLSLCPDARALREANLRELFGSAILDVVCLDTGADKDLALAPYKDSGLWWIEDKFENFKLGQQLGLKSILVEHAHNAHLDHEDGYRVNTWAEIYDLITRGAE